MRLLIISDVHANLPALDAILSKERFDKILCAGDVVDYGPHPNEVIEALRSLNTICVMGDHEYAVLTGRMDFFNPYAAWCVEWTRKVLKDSNKEWLRTLRTSERLLIDGKTLAVYHGSPFDPLWEYVFPGVPKDYLKTIIRETRADVVILGHTHIPMIFEWRGKFIINPGSVGQPRDGDPRASYVLLDTKKMEIKIRRVEYDIDRTVEDMRREKFPEFLWRRLYEGL